MDGIHDLGGQPGFGRVDHNEGEPVFKARWEAKVFTLVNAAARAGAYQSVDQFRHAVERIDPEAYLKHGYYGRWLGGLETLLVEAGILSTETITARARILGERPGDLIAARPQAAAPNDGGIPCMASAPKAPLYALNDQVRSSELSPKGHTRLPSYARGKPGLITACHGTWIYPDASAHAIECPQQFLYTVSFDSADLGFEERFLLNLDLFEPYLTLSEPTA